MENDLMDQALWIEPFGGAAGDMLLAALLDLEHPDFGLSELRGLAARLFPEGLRLELEETRRSGLRGKHLKVSSSEAQAHVHRGLSELLELLQRAELGAGAQALAEDCLQRLGRAEARVHGIPLESVRFHEVGAVDTLLDIAGVALGVERLGVQQVYCSPPLLGSGTVSCAHGELPVPAPAVVQLLLGRPQLTGGDGERTTPTGAALLSSMSETFEVPPSFQTQRVGLGAGTRETLEGPANLLRIQYGLCATGGASGPDPVWLLEVNLDDMSAEEMGHALGEIRRVGALEAWFVPVQMKKDRPGVVLSALARQADRASLEQVVFTWTTSLGLRWTQVERTECERSELTVLVGSEPVRVKVRHRPQQLGGPEAGERDLFPEHDDVVRAAQAGNETLREVRSQAIQSALEALQARV